MSATILLVVILDRDSPEVHPPVAETAARRWCLETATSSMRPEEGM
jgi:hypothetical protein